VQHVAVTCGVVVPVVKRFWLDLHVNVAHPWWHEGSVMPQAHGLAEDTDCPVDRARGVYPMYPLLRCPGSPWRQFSIGQPCWLQTACRPVDMTMRNQLHLFRMDSAYVWKEV
jgi:hypothetical protein